MDRDEEADVSVPIEDTPAAFKIDQTVITAVGEYRNRPRFQDGQNSRKGRDGSSQNPLPGTTSEDAQREFQRIEAARNAHGLTYTPVGCEFTLECRNLLAQHV